MLFLTDADINCALLLHHVASYIWQGWHEMQDFKHVSVPIGGMGMKFQGYEATHSRSKQKLASSCARWSAGYVEVG